MHALKMLKIYAPSDLLVASTTLGQDFVMLTAGGAGKVHMKNCTHAGMV
jgi:hypothetical protein